MRLSLPRPARANIPHESASIGFRVTLSAEPAVNAYGLEKPQVMLIGIDNPPTLEPAR